MFHVFLAELRLRAKACSSLFLLAGLLTWRMRRPINEYIHSATLSVGALTKRLGRSGRSILGERGTIAAILAITCVGLWIRARYLFLPVVTDEAKTFFLVLKPTYVALSYYDSPNNHLLNTLLSHLMYVLFGNEAWVLRLPSFAAGVLIIPATYAFFRRHYDVNVGLLSASLTAVSVPLIWYATLSRGYSLLTLLFLLLLLVSQELKERDDAALWLLVGVLGALGVYTMPLMLYPYGICLTWIVLSRLVGQQHLPWKHIVASVAVTCLMTAYLYLPVFLVSGPASLVANEYVLPVGYWSMARGFPQLLIALWEWYHKDLPTTLKVVLPSFFVLAVLFHRAVSRDAIPIAIAVIAWLVPILLIQRVVPPWRAFVFLVPIYFGVCSAGAILIARAAGSATRWAAAVRYLAIMIAVVGSVNVFLADTPRQLVGPAGMTCPDEVINALREHLRPGDDVAARGRLMHATRYYLMKESLSEYLAWRPPDGPRVFFLLHADRQRLDMFSEFLKGYGAAVLVGRFCNVELYRLDRQT